MSTRAEWRDGWSLVAAAGMGMVVASSPIFSIGVFFAPLAAEFGWTKAQLAGAATINNAILVSASALVGHLVDRLGARKIALCGILGVSLAMATLSTMNDSVTSYWVRWVIVGMGVSLCSPLVWAKAIVSRFDRSRGLALAVTMSGSTLAGILAPVIVMLVMMHFGWRTAYLALAACMFIISFPMVFAFFYEARGVFRHSKSDASSIASGQSSRPSNSNGVTLRQAIRQPAFWLIAITFFLSGAAAAGVVVHLIPLLLDRGLAPMHAAAAFSLMSLAAVVGRLVTGYFLDRIPAPFIAAAVFSLPVLACVILIAVPSHDAVSLLASVLFGFAVGAELDLTTYITARCFGLSSYGKIYGLIQAAFAAGGAILPPLLGLVADRQGSYRGVIIVLASVFFASAVVLQFLRVPVSAPDGQ